jgi:short-subunit dehydrogenase
VTPPAAGGRALVTGASSGIGAAFARALARRGQHPILVARRADCLAALVEELGGDERATAIPLDLTEGGACAGLERILGERGFVVDMLVNNAGLGDTGRFHERPLERALQMVDLNSRVMVELTRRFLPPMVERRAGRLVNVVSTSAFQPVPFLAVYAASKAFALSFTEAIATELDGTGVRVQALCPGLTATEFQALAHTDRVPFNRTSAMTPEQVVEESLRALDRGRLTVVTGLRNRVSVTIQGFLPRALVRRVAGELFRPAPETEAKR